MLRLLPHGFLKLGAALGVGSETTWNLWKQTTSAHSSALLTLTHHPTTSARPAIRQQHPHIHTSTHPHIHHFTTIPPYITTLSTYTYTYTSPVPESPRALYPGQRTPDLVATVKLSHAFLLLRSSKQTINQSINKTTE
ncbi:hypothetical protein K504DRAFT_202144 [Pleomassaria siparia CBS 279.74]|uniref:Uncharacterized protein n=1 Tax=Pleomassaria siparia CBS 279.74 TaxID=1314801 RepID=A0A6G1KIA1_9PLEO|nr:hypothetical protein K504DRAFT_202144 [Pleomassaria siparia CBS 279.74]